MPHYASLTPQPGVHLHLWHLDESVPELLALWGEAPLPAHYAACTTDKRRREVLAVMLLLRRHLGRDVELYHRPDGSPYIDECLLSISHTKCYVAVALSDTLRVGVDVEMTGEKAVRAACRFLQPAERATLPAHHYAEAVHIAWSAKEVAYKLYPALCARYTEAITLTAATEFPAGTITARIGLEPGEVHSTEIYYTLYPDFVLAYAVAR